MPKESFLILRPLNGIFLCCFGLFIALLVISSLILRSKSEKTRRIVLATACLVTVVGFFVYKYFLSIDAEYRIANAAMGGFNWWSEFPLHLCNINMIIIPIAVWRKNRPLMSFSFFLGPLGALMALLMPSAGFAGYSILMPRMIGFYFTHFMVFVEGIALAAYGLYRPSFKDLPKTLLTILIVDFVIFLINFGLRTSGLCPKANYFFNMETEGNPVLSIFYNLIPYPFLYQIPLLLVIGAYSSVVMLGFKLAGKKQKADK
ncbi:MAG: YwaF family protein [Spirochaetales bacterium]|nr:YwaF family protein [Spirochaetales bacterium]